MTNITPSARVQALVGYQQDYGLHEAIIGLAVADAGGGGGGGSTDVTAIEDALGETTDTSSDSTVIGLLKAIAAGTSTASALTSDTDTITTTPNDILFAPSTARLEVVIQNKSSANELYVRVGGTASSTNSITLLPFSSIVISGFKAAQLISLVANGSTPIYYEVLT